MRIASKRPVRAIGFTVNMFNPGRGGVQHAQRDGVGDLTGSHVTSFRGAKSIDRGGAPRR
jgi:hypothetical protein